MREPLEIPSLTAEEVEALDTLYRSTKDVRVRTRAHIILLAGEQRMTAPAIAKIVRTDDQAPRNWFKRWRAEGIEGLKDRPKPTKSRCSPLSDVGPEHLGNPIRCGRTNA